MTKRPEWWGREYFLDELERTGGPVRRVVEDAAAKEDCSVSANTLYGDVLKWRRKDVEFVGRYDKILEEVFPGNASRFVTRAAKSNAVLSTQEQHAEFIEVLMKNNFKVTPSCEEFGIAPGHVFRKLNPESPHFDEEFQHLWELAESAMIAKVYDRVVENAMDGGPVGLGSDSAQKLLMTNRAPYLFPERRRIDVKEEKTTVVEIGPRLLSAVRDRFRALSSGNGNGDVIDVSEVRVLHGETSSESG